MASGNFPTITLPGFKAINNIDDPARLGNRDLTIGNDIELDATGMPSQRKGRVIKYASANCHSLYSDGTTCLFVENGLLKKLESDLITATTIMDVGNTPMAYWSENNIIYLTNGVLTGYVDGGVFYEFDEPTEHLKTSPISGHMICIFKGRLMIPKGSKVFYPEAMFLNQFVFSPSVPRFDSSVSWARNVRSVESLRAAPDFMAVFMSSAMRSLSVMGNSP